MFICLSGVSMLKWKSHENIVLCSQNIKMEKIEVMAMIANIAIMSDLLFIFITILFPYRQRSFYVSPFLIFRKSS